MVCGVDISKKSFNFCIVDNNLNKLNEGKFSLVRDDLIKFIQIVNEFNDIVVIVESTGMRPFIIPCQLRELYQRLRALSNLPSKNIAN